MNKKKKKNRIVEFSENEFLSTGFSVSVKKIVYTYLLFKTVCKIKFSCRYKYTHVGRLAVHER